MPHVRNAFDTAVDTAAASLMAETYTLRTDRPKSMAHLRRPTDTVVVTTVSRVPERSKSRVYRSKTRAHLSNPSDIAVVTAETHGAEGSRPRTNLPKPLASRRNPFDTAAHTGDSSAMEIYTARADRPTPMDYRSNSSNTVVATTASCSERRSTPSTGQARLGAPAEFAVDTNEEAVVDVLLAAAGSEIIAVEPTNGTTVDAGSSSSHGGIGTAEDVVKVACKLATQSHCPDVREAATLVSILVVTVSDRKGNAAEVESRVKRCRHVTMLLERASLVLEKVRLSGCDNHTFGHVVTDRDIAMLMPTVFLGEFL